MCEIKMTSKIFYSDTFSFAPSYLLMFSTKIRSFGCSAYIDQKMEIDSNSDKILQQLLASLISFSFSSFLHVVDLAPRPRRPPRV